MTEWERSEKTAKVGMLIRLHWQGSGFMLGYINVYKSIYIYMEQARGCVRARMYISKRRLLMLDTHDVSGGVVGHRRA